MQLLHCHVRGKKLIGIFFLNVVNLCMNHLLSQNQYGKALCLSLLKKKRQKFKTDPLTFSLFHFSPLTFSFVISIL